MNEIPKYTENEGNVEGNQVSIDSTAIRTHEKGTEKFLKRLQNEIDPKAEKLIAKLSPEDKQKFIEEFNNAIHTDLETYGIFNQKLLAMNSFVNNYVIPKLPENELIAQNDDTGKKVVKMDKEHNLGSYAFGRGFQSNLKKLFLGSN